MTNWIGLGMKLLPWIVEAVKWVEKFISAKGQRKQDAAVYMIKSFVGVAESVTARNLLDDEDISTPNSSTEGKPIWESTASFAISTFDDQEQSTDPSANNVGIETVADSIIDFTEGNPFSEGNI